VGKAARKLNFLIEETVCKDLETLVPAGKRSKIANDALRRELELIRRKNSFDKILLIRAKGRKFSNREINDSLSKDREQH